MEQAWSPAFARLAWRLHVPAAVADVTARAQSAKLSAADRRLALDTLAFIIKDAAASKTIFTMEQGRWADARHGDLLALEPYVRRMVRVRAPAGAEGGRHLQSRGRTLREVVVPKPAANLPQLWSTEIIKLSGNAARGKEVSTRCVMCHSIAGTGADLGPALDGWGQGKSPEVIATAIVRPSAEIANGYDGTEIKTKDGMTIQGVLIKEGDPLMMRSMGGLTQVISANRLAAPRRRMAESLMMSGAQLGLTAQDVANLVAFLRGN